jgi:hypothetical protein
MEGIRTPWCHDFGKMITMNGMLIIFKFLVKFGMERGMRRIFETGL